MPPLDSPASDKPRPRWQDAVAVGFALTLALLVIGGVVGYVHADRLSHHTQQLGNSNSIILALENLLSTLKDAETGQRGYLLTAEPSYLAPYELAQGRVLSELTTLSKLLTGDDAQLAELGTVTRLINSKLIELARTIELEREGNREQALAIVRGDSGRAVMDQLRSTLTTMENHEQARHRELVSEADASFRSVVTTILFTAGTGMLLVTFVYLLTQRNIRLRQRNFEIVAEQREQLRTTLASIGDAVLTTDEHARVTFLNPVAEELTGWKLSDAVGQPMERIFHIVNESSRKKVENPAVRALQEGVIVGLANHTVLIGRTGTERPIDDSAAPIRLGSRILGAVLVFRDVTERRAQEQKLTRAHAALASSLDAMSAELAVLNQQGEILLGNQAWQAWATSFDASRHGMRVGESFLRFCQEGTTAQCAVVAAGIAEVLAGTRQSFQQEYQRDDLPEPKWHVLRASRFIAGDESRVIISHENVTERKLAELADFKRNQETALRADISSALGMRRPLTDGLQAVCEILARQNGLRAAKILVAHETADSFDEVASTFQPGESQPAEQLLAKAASLSQFTILEERFGNDFHAAAPLIVEGRKVGLLTMHCEPAQSADILAAVGPAIDQISQHIDRKHAEEALGRSEEQFRTLAESIPQMSWMADAEGRPFWFNRRWMEYTGRTSDQLKTDARAELHDPEIRPQAIERWKQSLVTGEPFSMVFPLRGKDGTYRQFLTLAVPLRDEAGRVVRWFGTNTDISETKRVEAELREARSRLDSTLAAGEIGTWEFDLLRDQIRIDPNLSRMMGGMIAPGVSAPLDQYLPSIHADDRERLLATLGESLRSGQNFHGDYRLVHADGSIRWVSARGRVERDEHGQPIRLPGVVVDVTAQRLVEDRLRESEARFRQIADTMPQIVWVTKPDGFHEYYNQRWYEFIGRPDGSTDGEGWNGMFHPDDQPRAWARWNHSLTTGEPYEIEYRLRHHSGSYRWFLGRALPVRDDAGQIIKWFGTCTDIEDFKRIEAERQKFFQLAENSTDFIGMCDLEGVPFYINKAGLELVGLDGPENLAQSHIRDFFFPEDQRRVSEEFMPHVLREGSGEIEVRFRNVKTGDAAWMLHRVFAIASPRGRIILATVSRDITQRRQLEDDLRRLAADLSEANHRKDEFLATLAHELRNPLAPIRSGLEVLKLSANDPARLEEVRGTMERQTQQMVRLIDDLLDVSRITQGKLELRRARVDVADVLRSAIEATRPFIDEAGHQLFVQLPLETVWLDADPNRLAQVVSNLLHNSTKYTPERGRIQLSAVREGHVVIVKVTDNGIGIAPEMQGGIFEMFAQIDRPLEKGYKGLGIGLTLVKRLVEMHGGQIEVHSAGAGQGSEFTVRLPLLQEVSHEAQRPETPRTAPPVQTRRRVLVVDDNTAAADMLTLVVKMLGNDVRTAYDGQQGVEMAETFSPDVVLMDIGMPRMNGYEAARHLRQQPWARDMVLVALTGWGQEEDKQRARDAGFDHHLVKPAEPAELQRVLNSAARPGNPRPSES